MYTSARSGIELQRTLVLNYIAITGSASLQDMHLVGKLGGTGNALEAGPRKQLSRTCLLAALGPCRRVAGTLCLVQPGPKLRALFLQKLKLKLKNTDMIASQKKHFFRSHI